jgi:prepilin-type N-terminal cleavage/methylation domain-containing protein
VNRKSCHLDGHGPHYLTVAIRTPSVRSRRVRSAGFTLIELMVVVVMIGIVTTIALQYTGERRANLRGFASEIVGEADSARLRASSSRRWMRIGFDVDAGQARVEQANFSGMDLPEDDEWTMVRTFTIPREIVVASIATTANVVDGDGIPAEGDGLDEYLMFSPDGGGAARTVYLKGLDNRNALRVVVYRATGSAYAKEGW